MQMLQQLPCYPCLIVFQGNEVEKIIVMTSAMRLRRKWLQTSTGTFHIFKISLLSTWRQTVPGLTTTANVSKVENNANKDDNNSKVISLPTSLQKKKVSVASSQIRVKSSYCTENLTF